MKKVILNLLLLIFVTHAFCQSTNQAISKDYYLKKSKTQKTIAWVMLSVGAATSITGLIIEESEVNKDPVNYFLDDKTGGAGTVMIITGGGIALGSIPLFIISSKNKNKAAEISFINQRMLVPQQNSFAYKLQPAVSLKINL